MSITKFCYAFLLGSLFCLPMCPQAFAQAQCESMGDDAKYKECLMGAESGGNTAIVGVNFSYIGSYQWGGPALHDVGVCSGTTIDGCGWNGPLVQQFNATHPPGITRLSCCGNTLADARSCASGPYGIIRPENATCNDAFLSNSANAQAFQEFVRQKFDELSDQRIHDQGLDQYCGQTINGIYITKEVLRAMAHLGGSGNLKKWLESGGKDNFKDGNNTPISSYGGCMTMCMKQNQPMTKCNKLAWGGGCFKPISIREAEQNSSGNGGGGTGGTGNPGGGG